MVLEAEKELTHAADAEKKRVLFVCTGNTCRSPMAEAVFARDYGHLGFTAESAGLFADGSPISANAAEALREEGYHGDGHVSRQLTVEMICRADLIVGISASHMMQIIMACPEAAAKTLSMPRDICDPYGGDLQVYERCLSDIKEGLGILFENYGKQI